MEPASLTVKKCVCADCGMETMKANDNGDCPESCSECGWNVVEPVCPEPYECYGDCVETDPNAVLLDD